MFGSKSCIPTTDSHFHPLAVKISLKSIVAILSQNYCNLEVLLLEKNVTA